MKRKGFTLLEVSLALALFGIGVAGALTLQAQSTRLIRSAASLDRATEIGRQTLHGIRTTGFDAGVSGCRDPWQSTAATGSTCQVTAIPCELRVGRLDCSSTAPDQGLRLVTIQVIVGGGTPLVLSTLVRRER